MRTNAILVVAAGLTAGTLTHGRAMDPPPGFPSFKAQEIDTGLTIGYAVIIADINGDKKPDIVVVDKHKVVWYENPTWKKRVILDGKTKPDNVCIAALDIDGDGLPELVLGAGWKPSDTKTPGTLQWLKRGKSLDDEWTMHPIPCDEPTVHRLRVFDIDGDGVPEIVHVPLQGRECNGKRQLDRRPAGAGHGVQDPEGPGEARELEAEGAVGGAARGAQLLAGHVQPSDEQERFGNRDFDRQL